MATRTTEEILSLFQTTPERERLKVLGAVRLIGTDPVFTLGEGGRPIGSPEDLLTQGFRSEEVQEVSPEEAISLGIKIPEAQPTVVQPTAGGTTPDLQKDTFELDGGTYQTQADGSAILLQGPPGLPQTLPPQTVSGQPIQPTTTTPGQITPELLQQLEQCANALL